MIPIAIELIVISVVLTFICLWLGNIAKSLARIAERDEKGQGK